MTSLTERAREMAIGPSVHSFTRLQVVERNTLILELADRIEVIEAHRCPSGASARLVEVVIQTNAALRRVIDGNHSEIQIEHAWMGEHWRAVAGALASNAADAANDKAKMDALMVLFDAVDSDFGNFGSGLPVRRGDALEAARAVMEEKA